MAKLGVPGWKFPQLEGIAPKSRGVGILPAKPMSSLRPWNQNQAFRGSLIENSLNRGGSNTNPKRKRGSASVHGYSLLALLDVARLAIRPVGSSGGLKAQHYSSPGQS